MAAAAALAFGSTGLPLPLVGRSRICPTLDLTMNSGPRYLLIVLAFAGDSTITKDFAIVLNNSRFNSVVAVQTAHIYKDKLQTGQAFSQISFSKSDPIQTICCFLNSRSQSNSGLLTAKFGCTKTPSRQWKSCSTQEKPGNSPVTRARSSDAGAMPARLDSRRSVAANACLRFKDYGP